MKKLFLSGSLMLSFVLIAPQQVYAQENRDIESIFSELKSLTDNVVGEKSQKDVETVKPTLKDKEESEKEVVEKEKSSKDNSIGDAIAESSPKETKKENKEKEYKKDAEVINGKYVIHNKEKYNNTFLRNIPAGTILISDEDILFQAGRKYLFFDDGKITPSSPYKDTNKATFCYIKVPVNNSRIVLPSDGYRGLMISFSEPVREVLDDGNVVYAHRFWFGENDLFDSMTCISSNSKKPLTITDFSRETGDRFKLRFAPVVRPILFE